MNRNPERNFASNSKALSAILALVLLGGVLPACSAKGASAAAEATKPAEAAKASGPVAEIDGKLISRDELEKEAAEQFQQLEEQKKQVLKQIDDQRQKILEGTLNQLVEKKLIEAAAAKRGVSSDELLKAEVDSKVAQVTPEEISKFYDENKARVGNQTLEQLSDRIKTYLQQQRSDKVRTDFLAGLRKDHKVRLLLEVPRVAVEVANAPTIGPASAPITIVEWSDFQCPYCSKVAPTLHEVKAKYGDKVRIAFRQFPLSFHQQAQKAAEAALCAHEQGKFWELHDAMFGNQQALGVDQLKAKAAELGINADQFNSCVDGGKYVQWVKDDMAAGSAAGVTGTPAMFINGRMVSGAVPFEQLAQIIDDELARKGG